MGKSRIQTIILILVLALSTLAIQQAGPRFASAQFLPNSVEIGYGPNSLFPVSSSIPVFGYNDQMWVVSSYSSGVTTFQLRYGTYSGTYVLLPFQNILPDTITLLYTFTSMVEKNWSLLVTIYGVSLSIPITYVNSIPAPNGSSITYFSGNELGVNFTFSDPNIYNTQACFVGANSGNISSATLSVPSNLGPGSIIVTPDVNMDRADLVSVGAFKSVVFWFELLYSYSFAQINSSGVVSTQIETSKSTPVLTSSNPPTNTESVFVQNNVALRPGRYVLRGFFDDSGNVSVTQTSILLLGGNSTWAWLGGCYATRQNSLTSFTSLTSISESPSARPQTLFLMYDSQGVESYSIFDLNVSVGEVTFTTLPFNSGLSNVGVVLQSNKQVSSSAYVDGVMYLVCSQFPVNVRFNFAFASETFATSETTITGPALPPSVNIPLSEIVVNVTNHKLPVPGVNATLHRGSSILFNVTTNAHGLATFYVPAGNYSVSATYLGTRMSNSVLTSVGQSSAILLQFSVSPTVKNPPQDYSSLLIAVVVIGIAGNFFVWRSVLNRRKQYV